VDITLGPWTAEMSIAEAERKPLAAAMGSEALSTVRKTAGFTAKEAVMGKPAKTGFTISGKLTNVVKQGGSIQVKATFTLWADGTFSNVAPLAGDGTASGGASAEDVVRAITEGKVKQLLDAVRSGRAKKAR